MVQYSQSDVSATRDRPLHCTGEGPAQGEGDGTVARLLDEVRPQGYAMAKVSGRSPLLSTNKMYDETAMCLEVHFKQDSVSEHIFKEIVLPFMLVPDAKYELLQGIPLRGDQIRKVEAWLDAVRKEEGGDIDNDL